MPKTVKVGLFEIFKHPLCCKISKKLRGTFGTIKKFEQFSEKKTKNASKKIGYSMLGLRKPNFKTKIIHFEISHNAENCKRGPFEIF